MSTARVIVVGAGVIGASVAERLATRPGVQVTVLEQSAPASGTSGTSFAWVNSNGKAPRAYHELNVAGMAEFARRRNELRGAYHHVGHLEVATEPAAAERLAARATDLAASGYRAEPISSAQFRELEPAVVLPSAAELIVHFPDEGYCDVDRLVQLLLGTVRNRGGEVRAGVGVVDVQVGPHGVTVRTTDGNRLAADRVVLCCGRWTPELTGRLGLPIPMETGVRSVGLLALTGAIDRRPSRVISTPGLNVRPFHERRLMLQALDLDAAPAAPETAREFAARAEALVPIEPALRVEALLPARRAIPIDGLTAAGWLDRQESVYAIATHSGVTLSLLLGRLAAEEVADARPSPLLAPFRAGRFVGTGTDARGTASSCIQL